MDDSTEGMGPIQEWIVPYVEQQRLVMDYMAVSAVAIFYYDYLLTLRLEIKLIWFSPWSYTKVIFLLVRYLGFADTFLILHNQIFPNLSAERCMMTFTAAMWLIIFKMSLAEAILAVRTWAVWHRNRTVGIGLTVVTIANFVAQCTTNGIASVLSMKYLPPLYPGFKGCYVTPPDNGTLMSNYAALTAVETIVLSLMMISAFRSYRLGHMGEFSHVIHRDAIMFYVVLLCISVVNVVMPILDASAADYYDTLDVLTPLEAVLYSVLTARIMLNIRGRNYRGLGVAQTELHTGYRESLPVFVRSPDQQCHQDQQRHHGQQLHDQHTLPDGNSDAILEVPR